VVTKAGSTTSKNGNGNSNNKKPPIEAVEIDNFRGIEHVRISVARFLVIIGGGNGQGKTSVLKALAAAVAGKRGSDGKDLRDGAKEGRVILDLGDREIFREIGPNGPGGVRFREKPGAPPSTKQARLDLLFSKLSFDPLAFMNAAPKEQRQMLLEALALDFSAQDARRQKAYDERTEIGRERDRLKGALDKFPLNWCPPDSPVSVAELSAELQAATAQNHSLQVKRQELAAREYTLNDYRSRMARNKAEIERLTAENARIFEEGKAFKDETARMEAEIADVAEIDTTEILAQIEAADKTNQDYREGQQRAQLGQEFEECQSAYAAKTAEIVAIDAEKAALLAEADLGVTGVEITEEGVTLDGRPLANACGAERLQLSLSVAFKLVNPELPLVCVDGGESLDGASLDIVREMAEEAGVVVFMTRVTDGECDVRMQDGRAMDVEEWAERAAAAPDSLPALPALPDGVIAKNFPNPGATEGELNAFFKDVEQTIAEHVGEPVEAVTAVVGEL
jgi:hypothetical protein